MFEAGMATRTARARLPNKVSAPWPRLALAAPLLATATPPGTVEDGSLTPLICTASSGLVPKTGCHPAMRMVEHQALPPHSVNRTSCKHSTLHSVSASKSVYRATEVLRDHISHRGLGVSPTSDESTSCIIVVEAAEELAASVELPALSSGPPAPDSELLPTTSGPAKYENSAPELEPAPETETKPTERAVPAN
jgi:hypothetical protein